MRALALGVLVACALAPLPADAHKGRIQRSLHFEASEGGLVVLAHISVSGDTRKGALIAAADLDADGQLSGAEKDRLRDDLAARALADLSLWGGGQRLVLERVQAKLKLTEDGPIEVVAHGVLPWPKAPRVALRTTGEAAAVDVRVLQGGLRFEGKQGRRVRPGIVEVTLGPGDEVVLRRVKPPAAR